MEEFIQYCTKNQLRTVSRVVVSKLLTSIGINVPQRGGNITWVEIEADALFDIYTKKDWIHETDDFAEKRINDIVVNELNDDDAEDPPLPICSPEPPILEKSEIDFIRELHRESVEKYKLMIDTEPPPPPQPTGIIYNPDKDSDNIMKLMGQSVQPDVITIDFE